MLGNRQTHKDTHLNPILAALGFNPDDIGSCHASVDGYRDLIDFGTLSSASVMVPCPWFPALASYARQRRGALDLGVHLTLTCEWDALRWGPISTSATSSGLVDDEGYFPRRREQVQDSAAPAAVRDELAAQIERARAAGIELTHCDTHMFTLLHPRLLPMYFELSSRYRVPVFAPRRIEDAHRSSDYFGASMPGEAPLLADAEARGALLFDGLVQLPTRRHEARLDEATALLRGLGPGLSLFIVHPALDTPELRAMAADWRARVADYELFTSEAWRRRVRESGVTVIGYRVLRDVLFPDTTRADASPGGSA
jgi:chitin disaccharide deacetylase